MTKQVNEFVVETLEHCFLCMNKISKELNQPKCKTYSESSQYPSIYSLKYLSKYLKMNLKKVFSDSKAIPAKLLAKVDKSRLKVRLCDNCGPISTRLANLIQQLEKIQMEIMSSLETFKEKLLTGDVDELFEHLIKYDLNSNAELKSKLDIMRILRDEALQKCSKSLTQAAPRVKIQKLTRKEINAQVEVNNLYLQKKGRISTANYFLDLDASTLNIKLEESSPYDCRQLNFNEEDDIMQDSKLEAEDFEQTPPHTEDEAFSDENDSYDNLASNEKMKNKKPLYTIIQPVKITTKSGKLKFINVNPESRKHRCSICANEFASWKNARDHFRSIHLKLQYQCRSCPKVFRYVQSFRRHYQIDHACVKVECKKCNKLFKQNGYLLTHMRSVHSQVRKHVCQVCGSKFKLKHHLKKHLRTIHSVLKLDCQ